MTEDEKRSGWIACDGDGCLWDHSWRDILELGQPVPLMVARVKAWLADGWDVRIFTARVGASKQFCEASGMFDSEAFALDQRRMIEEWCVEHIGQKLPVTASKDFACLAIYDDRAVRVERDTGRLL